MLQHQAQRRVQFRFDLQTRSAKGFGALRMLIGLSRDIGRSKLRCREADVRFARCAPWIRHSAIANFTRKTTVLAVVKAVRACFPVRC
jgi:hypothetical protein